jgi:hypothetical protein
MPLKTYTTFQGAQRAAQGKPILRVLDDPHEVWVVLDKLDTDLMIYTAEGRRYELAGKCSTFFVATGR